jgi:hypothetical protein
MVSCDERPFGNKPYSPVACIETVTIKAIPERDRYFIIASWMSLDDTIQRILSLHEANAVMHQDGTVHGNAIPYESQRHGVGRSVTLLRFCGERARTRSVPPDDMMSTSGP